MSQDMIVEQFDCIIYGRRYRTERTTFRYKIMKLADNTETSQLMLETSNLAYVVEYFVNEALSWRQGGHDE